MALGSYKICRLFGIDIELDWTFLLLLLLVAVLTSVYLIVVFILLFVCVLIHELAHSITSQKNGIAVKKIILTPLGGASIIDETNIDPRVEFNISIVGPVMSLVIGALFGIAVIFTPPGIISQIAQVMFELNILLGVFNLIPSFPLDGGRVLRSYLQRKHSLYDATMITATVSKYFMAFIVIGTVAYAALFVSSSILYAEVIVIFDLLIVLILYGGMKGEVQNVQMREATKGLRIGDFVTRRFITVSPNASISEIYKLIRRKREYLLITKVNGVISSVSLTSKKGQRARYAKDLAVPIPVVDSRSTIIDTLARMEGAGISIVAVKRGKAFIGIVTGASIQSVISLHMLKKNS